MIGKDELLDLCNRIVKEGKSLGAEAIEVQAEGSKELESNIEMGQVSSVQMTSEVGIAIRVIIGKKIGSAFTNIPTKEATKEALELALAAARATTDDDNWTSLPGISSYPSVDGLWKESVTKVEASKVAELATEIVEKSTALEPGLIAGFGGSGALDYVGSYANSNGVSHAEKGTVAYIYLAGVAPTETGMTPSVFEVDFSRGIELDIDRVVDEIVSTIRIVKNTSHGKSGKHTIVMHPSAYSQLMQFTLLQSIRGDNVARGKSKIGDKLGETIASEKITIIDDGTDSRGLNASEVDDEGTPRQRTPIIEKGVLRSFIWDHYWAQRMGVKSTGNAKRNKRQGLVEVATSNIVIEPGIREVEDIISEIDYGYYIRGVQGAHSSNPESGDFSIVGNPAILIEKGKMVGAVHGLMVSGNIFDLLKQTVEVAKIQRNMQTFIGPDIVFRDVDIICKE